MLLGPIDHQSNRFIRRNEFDLLVCTISNNSFGNWSNWSSLFDGVSTIFCSCVGSHVTVFAQGCVPTRVLVQSSVTITLLSSDIAQISAHD